MCELCGVPGHTNYSVTPVFNAKSSGTATKHLVLFVKPVVLLSFLYNLVSHLLHQRVPSLLPQQLDNNAAVTFLPYKICQVVQRIFRRAPLLILTPSEYILDATCSKEEKEKLNLMWLRLHSVSDMKQLCSVAHAMSMPHARYAPVWKQAHIQESLSHCDTASMHCLYALLMCCACIPDATPCMSFARHGPWNTTNSVLCQQSTTRGTAP